MPPPPDRVLARYRLILNRNRNITAAGFAAAWDRLDTHDETDIATFTESLTDLTRGAETATVAAATAFTALLLDIPAPPVTTLRLPSPRWRDPFTAFWHALDKGRPFTEALAAGRSAAEAAAVNHVQSVARRAGDDIATAAGRDIRWRREAEPGACSWCRVRDGNTYRTAASADFGHNRCFCDVVPAT